ncbi:MAG: HsdR family type I site-specific deoxyribonuclease [Bacteroidota bacterium]
MNRPSFKEDHISQVPAIQLLVNMGYSYLPPEEALKYRGGKESNVLLDDVLEGQLMALNDIRYKGQVYAFTEANIHDCMRQLRHAPLNEGLLQANKQIHELLVLGTSREQRIGPDKKSFSIKYIDWHKPENNVYHVTEELSVLRTDGRRHYRPDLVLYVNGIPMAVIECKRPDAKDPLGDAISQQLRNQQVDGIRPLFVYAQLLMGIATNEATYATTCTEPEFWSRWKEAESEEDHIKTLIDQPLPEAEKMRLFGDRFRYVRAYFEQLGNDGRQVTEQDRYLYYLCRPDRLLDLSRNFTLFDNGIKKIARYQQYFAIKQTMARIHGSKPGSTRGSSAYNLESSSAALVAQEVFHPDSRGSAPGSDPRKSEKTNSPGSKAYRGGVIWHTQGSGKSLTMVLLANAIAESPRINNPKIIIVTDRINLDKQISETFRKCGKIPERAATGADLIDKLEAKSDAVITTVINKFVAAVNRRKEPFLSSEIFVLVDEGHRTQYGTFNVAMRKVFPNACFLAFTGTPLTKKQKNTTQKFGGIIDSYTVREAVEDGAVVPLIYEGRMALLEVDDRPLEAKFERLMRGLTPRQVSDFKRKYSRASQIDKTQQGIEIIANDITSHFQETWSGTPFKAQLVTPDKKTAVRYYRALQAIPEGLKCELVISAPDMREGEESAFEESDQLVKQFWKSMMDKHGSAEKYQDNIVAQFESEGGPELIIVVDKLLTGFDAPYNRTLYLARRLYEHTLLQAIARVNRVAPAKDYGLIVDYMGVLKELHEAIQQFGDDYDAEDLEGAVTELSEAITDLPQKQAELWSLFRGIQSKNDLQAYQAVLADDPLRDRFYELLSQYARKLQLVLGSFEWHEKVGEEQVKKYKDDLGFFSRLRAAVRNIYSDTVDYGDYEKQIQKLIDQHVTSYEVEQITEQVSIFDVEAFAQEVEKIVGLASKADLIASRTARHINERMEDDEVLYRRFSKMLEETIEAYREQRLSEAEYFNQVSKLRDQVLRGTDDAIPAPLRKQPVAQAIFGQCQLVLLSKTDEANARQIATESALAIDAIIRSHVLEDGQPKIDWTRKDRVLAPLLIELEDYLYDHIRQQKNIILSAADRDELAEAIVKITKRRYAS